MYQILLWLPLWLMIMASATDVGNKPGNNCESGQYESDFLSGGCAKCPTVLKDCEDQEINDAVRCYNACRGIYSSPEPTMITTSTHQDRKPSALLPPASLPTETPNITIVVVVNKTFNRPTLSDLTSEKAGNGYAAKIIIIGISCSLVALVVVIGVFVALCWAKSRRSGTRNVQRSTSYTSDYTAVAVNSRSNSNEDIESSFTTIEQRDVLEADGSTNIPSLSLEGLNNMDETNV